jgi:hypothetical protein
MARRVSFAAICFGVASTAAQASDPAVERAILVCQYEASTFCGIEGQHSGECLQQSKGEGTFGQIDLNLKEQSYRLTTTFRGIPVSTPIFGKILNRVKRDRPGYSPDLILFLSSGQIVTIDDTDLVAVLQHAGGGAAITAIYQCKQG